MSVSGSITPNGVGIGVDVPPDYKLVLVPNDQTIDTAGTSAGDGTNGSAFLQKLQQDSADHLDGSYHTTPLADVANDRGLSSEPYVRDVRAAFSAVPRIRPQWTDRYMKILVVGESGMGKTTFVKNLFASYTLDADIHVASSSSPTSREIFERNPAELCTEIVVEDDSNQNRFHYRVQDTPGWEDLGETMDLVLGYVKGMNEECLEQEQDARRAGPMHKSEDPRVDVCIYFVSPHRIKKVDVKFMDELSKHVPVVPVLAKADTMTTTELANFRKEVRAALQRAAKQSGRDIMYTFSPAAVAESHAGPQAGPFAIICSRQMDLKVGRFWPVRQYPWGTCEALSSEHSDFALLKKLLLESAYQELKDETERRYYEFREEELSNLAHSETGQTFKPRFILNRQPRRKHTPVPMKALKWLAATVLTYAAGAFLLGGRERLQADVSRTKDIAIDVKDTVVDVATSAFDNKVKEPERKKVLGIF